jgi:hypothetical protein
MSTVLWLAGGVAIGFFGRPWLAAAGAKISSFFTSGQ